MATYTIKSGDTLSKIAQANGTTIAAIMKANPSITDANKIRAGASLTIPSQSSPISFVGLNGGINSSMSTNTSTPATSFQTTPAKSPVANSSAPAPQSQSSQSQPTFDISGTPLAAAAAKLGSGQSSTQSSTQTTPAQTTASVPETINTGNPAVDAAYSTLYSTTKSTLDNGGVINPNININDPTIQQQFINEAVAQLSPQYQQQMMQEADSLNASLTNLATQYAASQGQTLQQFQQDLNTERNAAGGAGVAFSGGRGLAEQNMQNTTNRTLQSLDSNYAFNVGNAVRQGAAALGTNANSFGPSMNSINIPTLMGASVNLGGAYGGSTPTSALDIGYNPSNFGIGSIPLKYNSDVYQGGQTFQNLYLQSAANNSAVKNPLNTTVGNQGNIQTGISQGLPSFASLNS